jgi:hypothetical protein
MFVFKALKEETEETNMKSNKINKHKTDRNSALIIVSIFAKGSLYFLRPAAGRPVDTGR